MSRALVNERASAPPRFTDAEWVQIASLLARITRSGGRPPVNRRRDIEAMRWIAWTERPWSRLPEELGNPSSVRRSFNRLCRRGAFDELMKSLRRPVPDDRANNEVRASARKLLECLADFAMRRSRG